MVSGNDLNSTARSQERNGDLLLEVVLVTVSVQKHVWVGSSMLKSLQTCALVAVTV